jgi:hypothetical protein
LTKSASSAELPSGRDEANDRYPPLVRFAVSSAFGNAAVGFTGGKVSGAHSRPWATVNAQGPDQNCQMSGMSPLHPMLQDIRMVVNEKGNMIGVLDSGNMEAQAFYLGSAGYRVAVNSNSYRF